MVALLAAARRSRRVVLALLTLLVGAIALLSTVGCVPGPGGRAADLDWLANRLPRLHKNLFFRLPQGEYRAALAELGLRVEELDDEQYFVAVSQILARLGDGHTGLMLAAQAQAAYGRYPLNLFWFADGVFVTASAQDISDTVGCRVVAIDGIPIAEVLERVATVVAKENDVSVLSRSPGLLVRPEVLYGLGVSAEKNRAEFTFARLDGSELRLRLEPTTSGVSRPVAAPMWWDSRAVIWHRYLEAERTLYIQYNSCQGDLTQATNAIVSMLDSKPVERIVFDMRRNGGGNSAVAQ